ncbi:class I SAM-dependent methyltransferase [Terrilactibacillus laevilacticus]|uniref:class I SAM-dependent methyltransferase n=1 Tax=Terrilactibacillus laevilacticus TaxID=1380157 RepID=UPI001146C311|nr:class I SAM-dependent methyltransferase [Terrilactibacillus laevilacticus]
MTSKNQWNSNLYDTKIDFVSKLGQGIFDILDPKQGERILDLGCGTGDLCAKIKEAGSFPIGIDLSESMIERARLKYPNIPFHSQNAIDYRTNEPFDAVFSNAALHWIKQTDETIETVHQALKKGGRFVAEFGGKGNIETISKAIENTLKEHGYNMEGRNPWYFPSLAEYSTKLEAHGFRVIHASHFDRPTELKGEDGLKDWLDMFSDDFFFDIPLQIKHQMYDAIINEAKPKLLQDGKWIADYKRLRIVAVKEN